MTLYYLTQNGVSLLGFEKKEKLRFVEMQKTWKVCI